jgi:hypothetical protein
LNATCGKHHDRALKLRDADNAVDDHECSTARVLHSILSNGLLGASVLQRESVLMRPAISEYFTPSCPTDCLGRCVLSADRGNAASPPSTVHP